MYIVLKKFKFSFSLFFFKYWIKDAFFGIPMFALSISSAVFESKYGKLFFYNTGAFGAASFFGFIVTGLYIAHAVFVWKTKQN